MHSLLLMNNATVRRLANFALMAFVGALFVFTSSVSTVLSKTTNGLMLKLIVENENLIVALVNESIGNVNVNGRFALGLISSGGADMELLITDEEGEKKLLLGAPLIRSVPKESEIELAPGRLIGVSFRFCDIKRYYGIESGHYKVVARFQTDPNFVFLKSVPSIIESESVVLNIGDKTGSCKSFGQVIY